MNVTVEHLFQLQDFDYENNTQEFRFRIAETDYTSYAIMYDCVQHNVTFVSGNDSDVTHISFIESNQQINQNQSF